MLPASGGKPLENIDILHFDAFALGTSHVHSPKLHFTIQ
jgi:hypothetical protein